MAKKRFTKPEIEVSVVEDEADAIVQNDETTSEEVEAVQEAPVETAPVAEKPKPEATKKPERVAKGRVYYSNGAGGRFRV